MRLEEEDKEEEQNKKLAKGVSAEELEYCGQAEVWKLGQMGNEN